MCEVIGEHVRQGLLQQPSRFAVIVRDSLGHRAKRGGDKVRASSRGPGPLRPSVVDEGDGSYTVSYLATVSGTYSLAVSCNSHPIPGSPFAITVEPSAAHAPSSIADGPGLRMAIAGEPASFFLRAHDEFGRPKIMGGEAFVAFVVPIRTSHRAELAFAARASLGGLGGAEGAWEEEEVESDGYSVAGSMTTQAPLKPRRHTNAPSSPRAANGGSHGRTAASVTSTAGGGGGGARRPHPHGGGHAGHTWAEDAAHDPQAVALEELDVHMADLGNGSYEGRYTLRTAGDYALHVVRDGVHIQGSPFSLRVRAGPADASRCILSADGWSAEDGYVGVAGVLTTLRLAPYDRFGNARRSEPLLKASGLPGACFLEATLLPLRTETHSPPVRCGVQPSADGACYELNYVATSAGEYEVAISLRGEPLPSRPHLTVLAGSTSPAASTARGDGLITATAGLRASFTIVARDSFGNARDVGTSEFEVAIWPAPRAHDAPHDAPHDPDGSRPLTDLSDPVDGGGGGKSTAHMYQPTQHALRRHGGSAGGRDGESLGPAAGDVAREPDGTCRASYVPTASGVAQLDVTLGGEHIAGSPFSPSVQPAPVSAESSMASGCHLQSATAGSSATFGVHTRDAFGNASTPREVPSVRLWPGGGVYGAPPEAGLSPSPRGQGGPPPSSPGCLSHHTPPPVQGEVRIVSEGEYVAEYVVQHAGQYLLDVRVGRELIVGSPFQLTVDAGDAHPPSCKVVRKGPPGIKAGQTALLCFESCDKHGNRRTLGGDPFVASLTRVGGGDTPLAAALAAAAEEEGGREGGRDPEGPPPPAVLDELNGLYTVGYGWSRAGTLRLSVTLHGVPIRGSPFALHVQADAPSAAHSEVYGEGLVGGVAGAALRLGVRLRDKHGSPCEPVPSGVAFMLRGSAEVSGEVRAIGGAGPGAQSHGAAMPPLAEEIEAVVTPSVAGRYWAHLTLNGAPIGGSPFAIAVRPARAHAPACELWGDGLSGAIAGVPAYFAVQLRDAHGNPTTEGLEGVTMRVAPPASAARHTLPAALVGGGGGGGGGGGESGGGNGEPEGGGGWNPADGHESGHAADDEPAGGGGVEWTLHHAPEQPRPINSPRQSSPRQSSPRPSSPRQPSPRQPSRQAADAAAAPPPSPSSAASFGLLSGVWRSLRAGRHYVHLQLHGAPLPGSPFAVGVRGGPTHASSSTLYREGGGGRFVAPHERVVVRILARDRWGNVRGEGGDDFHVFVRGASRPSQQEMEDLGAGEYELRLAFTCTGEYSVHIAHSQMPLRGSPLRMTVEAP